jgi:hypothetical protein
LLAVFASRPSPCAFTSIKGREVWSLCRPSLWTNTNMRYEGVVLR